MSSELTCKIERRKRSKTQRRRRVSDCATVDRIGVGVRNHHRWQGRRVPQEGGRFPGRETGANARAQIVETLPFLAEPAVCSRRATFVGTTASPSPREMSFHLSSDHGRCDASPVNRTSFTFCASKLRRSHRPCRLPEALFTALSSWMMECCPRIFEGKPQEWWASNFNRHPIGTGPSVSMGRRMNTFASSEIGIISTPRAMAGLHRISRSSRSTPRFGSPSRPDRLISGPSILGPVGHFQEDKRFDLFSTSEQFLHLRRMEPTAADLPG